MTESILFLTNHFHHLLSSSNERFMMLMLGRFRQCGLQVNNFSESAEQLRVDRVCLFEHSNAFAELPHLKRIGDAHRNFN